MYYIVYNVHIDVLLKSKRDTVVIETSQKSNGVVVVVIIW